jgi:hypothetical protein
MYCDDAPARQPTPRHRALQGRILRHGWLEYIVLQQQSYPRPMATFRLVSPEAAARAGGYPIERQFDIDSLEPVRGGLVELDEACIDRSVDPQDLARPLGEWVARYLIERGCSYVVSSIRLGLAEGPGVYLGIMEHASPDDLRVTPKRPIPMERLYAARALQAPALLRTHVMLGAWVCGEPAAAPGLPGLEIPLLLPLSRLNVREAKRYLARAA